MTVDPSLSIPQEGFTFHMDNIPPHVDGPNPVPASLEDRVSDVIRGKHRRIDDEEQETRRQPRTLSKTGSIQVSSRTRLTRTSMTRRDMAAELQKMREAVQDMQSQKDKMLESVHVWSEEREKLLLEQSDERVEQRVEDIKRDMLQQFGENAGQAGRMQSQEILLSQMADELKQMKEAQVWKPNEDVSKLNCHY